MDTDSGVSSAASFLSLSEPEQRFFSGLHALCQADTPGTQLSSARVTELFKASQLPPESLHKITEACGAKRLGYFGTTQFFVALKLIAAVQTGLPLRLESVTANLPPPRFVGLGNEPDLRHTTAPPPPSTDVQGATAAGSVSRTPGDNRGSFRHLEGSAEKKEAWSSSPSPCTSPPQSPPAYRSYAYAKQRNGTGDSQAAYESKRSSSRSVIQLEQHSSPSNYGTKATVEHAALHRMPSAERLEPQGPKDYLDDDPWRMTEEQLEYYTRQFKSLQPDLGSFILGTDAKNFFTKSKLPIPELSHIWELSDVDRDGALTFPEFCTAFHLIVARKNGYPLPKSLPATLCSAFFAKDQVIPVTPRSAESHLVLEEPQHRPTQLDRTVVEWLQPGRDSVTKDLTEEESSEEDHVVKRIAASLEKRSLHFGPFPDRPEPPQDLDSQQKTKTRPRSFSSTSIEDAMKKNEEPPTPPPRPQRTHSRASSLDLNKLQGQPGAPGPKTGWLAPPPALPPRPTAAQVSHFSSTPEKTPQKAVRQPSFADFTNFREEEEINAKPEDAGPLGRFGPSAEDATKPSKLDGTGVSISLAPQKPARRKYHAESQNQESIPAPSTQFPPVPTKPAQKLLSRQKKEIQLAIRKNKETNAVLKRLNSELQQQLKVVHHEKVTLESQLELLRPLTLT